MRTYVDTKKRTWRVPCLFHIDESMPLKKRRALEAKLLPKRPVAVRVAPLISLSPVLVAPRGSYLAFVSPEALAHRRRRP